MKRICLSGLLQVTTNSLSAASTCKPPGARGVTDLPQDGAPPVGTWLIPRPDISYIRRSSAKPRPAAVRVSDLPFRMRFCALVWVAMFTAGVGAWNGITTYAINYGFCNLTRHRRVNCHVYAILLKFLYLRAIRDFGQARLRDECRQNVQEVTCGQDQAAAG